MARPKAIKQVLDGDKNGVRGETCMGIYGNPGIGKTPLIASGSKTLIIHPPTDHLDSIREGTAHEMLIRDLDDIWEAYEYLRTVKAGEWHWVWLDTVTLWQDHCLDAIHADVVANKPHRARTPIDQSEYALESGQTSRWMRHMVALAKDYELFKFGWVAHAAELPLPPENELTLMPAVRGKNMSSKVCSYMNIVAYMEVKEGKRVLRTAPSDKYYSKDQYDAFEGGRMVSPTMAKISKAIQDAKPTVTAVPRRATRRRRLAA